MRSGTSLDRTLSLAAERWVGAAGISLLIAGAFTPATEAGLVHRWSFNPAGSAPTGTSVAVFF